MKETLRDRIECVINNITARIYLTEIRISVYKDADDFENAMKCSIKLETLINIKKN